MASPGGGAAHWIQTENPSWGPHPHPQNGVRSKPPSGSNLASTPPGREVRVRMGVGGDADEVVSPPARSTGNYAEARPANPAPSHPPATRAAPRGVASGGAVSGGGVAGGGGAAGEVDEEARALLAELKEVTTTNRALQIKTRKLRAAKTRVERLEEDVKRLREQVEETQRGASSEVEALFEEHRDLEGRLLESQAAQAAAAQEMEETRLRLARARKAAETPLP
ncbi:hypothetical protein T484DRAFT_1906769, partial [Baffinella frigidus]